MSAVAIVLWASLAYWLLVMIAAGVDAPHRAASGVRPIRVALAGAMVALCVAALTQWAQQGTP